MVLVDVPVFSGDDMADLRASLTKPPAYLEQEDPMNGLFKSMVVDRVDNGDSRVAFALHQVSIDQLMDVADAGDIMPPKSTWFEPKLRSGLFIHTF